MPRPWQYDADKIDLAADLSSFRPKIGVLSESLNYIAAMSHFKQAPNHGTKRRRFRQTTRIGLIPVNYVTADYTSKYYKLLSEAQAEGLKHKAHDIIVGITCDVTRFHNPLNPKT